MRAGGWNGRGGESKQQIISGWIASARQQWREALVSPVSVAAGDAIERGTAAAAVKQAQRPRVAGAGGSIILPSVENVRVTQREKAKGMSGGARAGLAEEEDEGVRV